MGQDMLDGESREALFRSQNPEDLVSLYQSFHSVADIRNFLCSRPKGKPTVVPHLGRGKPDCVAVVPTADASGPLASEFLRSFPHLDILLVESRGWGFNFAHSMNVGISAALELDPKWIVLTNDDLSPQSPWSEWRTEMDKREGTEWIKPTIYCDRKMLSSSWILTLLNEDTISWKLGHRLSQRSGEKDGTYNVFLSFARKLGVPPVLPVKTEPLRGVSDHFLAKRFRVTTVPTFLSVQPISIYRSSVLENTRFDERYTNALEDTDLSLRLAQEKHPGRLVRIGVNTRMGGSLGTSRIRWLRYNLPGNLLFAEKVRSVIEVGN